MKSFQKLCYVIVVVGLVEYSRSDENKTYGERQARVNGYMNKLYSGSKVDPVMCPKEGFLADPSDCTVFYRCIKSFGDKYTVYKFKCGPGTVYDPDTEICNHVRNTRRTECGGTLADRNIENEIDGHELSAPITTKLPAILDNTISQNYVAANKYPGFASPKPLSENYPMAPEDMNLVSLESSYKNPFVSAITPASEINKTPSTMTTSAIKTTTPKVVYTGENKQKDDECTKDGFMGDSENCRKFYRCVNNNHRGYIRYEFLCSDLTIWDDDLQSCNHPWAVRRRRCGTTQDMFPLSNMLDSNAISQPQPLYGDKDLSVIKEPVNDESNKNKTHGGNKYTLRPIIESVHPSTQMTSISTKYQTTATSTSKILQAFTNDYNSQITSKPEIHHTHKNPLTGEAQKDKIKENTQSINECSENGFMGDANDCRKFYRCVGSGRGRFIKYEFTCSDGTVWDRNLDSCNYAWAVKECGGRRQSSDTHANLSSTLSPVPLTTEPNSTPIKPIDKIYSSDTCISNGIFGDSNDCRIFFRCVDNGQGNFVKYVYKCDEGTSWDPTTQSCNYMDESTSCLKMLEKNKTLTTQKVPESVSISVSQSSTDKNENNINYDSNYISNYVPIKIHTSTKRSINKNTVCQMSGFFGDDNDCKTFYRCVDDGNGNFIQHAFSCGEGTVWDPNIEACNHAWSVKNCGGRASTSKANLMSSTTSTYSEKESVEKNANVHSTLDDTSTSKITTHEALKTTRSINQNECSEAGFRGDSNDCSKFYRCVDDGQGSYIQYDFSCGDGTVWDSKIEACNHKWAVENCNSEKEENDNIDSVSQSTSVSAAQTTKIYQTTTLLTIPSTSQPTILSSTQSSSNICESEGFHFDETDCQKFYRCVGDGRGAYTKYEFTCSDGTAWNREINACDYLDNTSCNDTKIDKIYHPETTVSSQKITTESSLKNEFDKIYHTETTVSSQKITTESSLKNELTFSGAKNQCKYDGFFANTDDCTKFYRCVHDGKGGYIKYDFSCGEGTIWVQENQICDHNTGISDCSTASTEAGSSSTNKYSTTTYSTTKITTTTQKQIEENDDTECESDGFYPHESNCRKFYRCVSDGNGKYTKYDFTCGEGTAWDTNLKACNHIKEVKRCETHELLDQKPEGKPPLHDEPLESESNDNVDTTKPSSSTTELYNIDKSTKPSATENDKTTTTTTAKTTSTTESKKPTNKDECKEDGYFGSTSNCKNFYRCVSNQNGGYTKYDFTCGEGTIWDQNILGCNHPENVLNASCKSSSSNQETETSTSSETDSSKSPDSSSSTSSSQSSTIQPTTDLNDDSGNNQSNNDSIRCTEAGFFANPNDCKKFYRCVDWDNKGERYSIFHFDCGEGTAWDQSLLTCNHEHLVNCSKQSENTTEESSTTEMSTTETSTEPSTTTKRSTTQSSTTTSKKPTTQKTTTQQTTTHKTTTQETTTQETTTQEPSTQKTTTQKTTTQEPTTQKSTTTTSTEQSTTTEPATEETSTTSTSTTTTTSTTPPQETTTTEQSTTTTTTEQASSTTTEENTQTTTQESTTVSTTPESQTESSTESSENKECPQTSEGEYLYVCPTSFKRHPKYCNLFYQCTEDEDTHESKIATFHCPNNTIYDESKIQCVEEKKADKKCDGEIAARRRVKRLGYSYKEPITVGKEKMSCKMPGYYLIEKTEECSPAFLKCESTNRGNVKGYVYKCPDGYLYWSISRRCEPSRKVKDCKRSSFDWTGRNELPVEKINVAP